MLIKPRRFGGRATSARSARGLRRWTGEGAQMKRMEARRFKGSQRRFGVRRTKIRAGEGFSARACPRRL